MTTVCLPLAGLAYQSKEHFLSLLGNSVQNPTMLTENTCAGPTVQFLSFSTGRNCGESRRQIPPAKTFSAWPLPAAGCSASVPIRAPNWLDPHVIFYYPIVSGYFANRLNLADGVAQALNLAGKCSGEPCVHTSHQEPLKEYG